MKVPKARKLESGTWFIQLRLNGISVPITAPTEKECTRLAALVKAEHITGKRQATQNNTESITLDEAITAFINRRDNVLSPSTIRGYEIIRKNRFKNLMQMSIRKINKLVMQQAVNDESILASPKTVKNAYTLVKKVLSDYNIDVSGVKLPQQIKPKSKFLEADEIIRLIDGAAGDSCEIPIVMAAWLGMRRSEICGLQWEAIDFKNKTIRIENTMVPDKDNKMVVKHGAKNESSQRTIKCPDYILAKLKPIKRETGPVFNLHPDTIRRHVHELCEKLDLPDCHLHGLRHANAAVMTSLGIIDKYAMARCGWKTDRTFKEIYSYLFDEEQAAADDKVNAFFESRLLQKEMQK